MRMFILLAAVLVAGCNEHKLPIGELVNAEIYLIPFSIHFPVDLGQAVLEQTPTKVSNPKDLQLLRSAVNSLELTQEAYFNNDVYLAIKLESETSSILVEYDKFNFRIEKQIYLNSPELVELALDIAENK